MVRLEFLRRTEGLSQVALARRLGYKTPFYICRLERYGPRPELVNDRLRSALEDYFGCPMADLFEQVRAA